MPPTTTDSHVIIVGAGIAGLALGQGLKKCGIPFTIFERDEQSAVRAQGYRLRMCCDSLDDLQYLLPTEVLNDFYATQAVTTSVESSINAVDGRLLARRAIRGAADIIVDRGLFREVLMHGIHDRILWKTEVTRYSIKKDNPNYPVEVHFADGKHTLATLLVGADGGRSRIRQQHVPDHKIIDPQAFCIWGRTMMTPELKEQIQPNLLDSLGIIRDVAPVLQQITSDSELPISMFVEPMHFRWRSSALPHIPGDYISWCMLASSKILGFIDGMDADAFSSSTSVKMGLDLSEHWDNSTRCLIERQDETYAGSLRVTSSSPNMSAWTSSPYVTLVGDAIHVMSPSGGVGVSTALKDVVALTKVLDDSRHISRDTIRKYETQMQSVARAAIEKSWRGGKLLYGQPPADSCQALPTTNCKTGIGR